MNIIFNKFIEVEDTHFKKMIIRIDSISVIHEVEISKTEIYCIGIEKPFISRHSYREIKSLLDKAFKE